MNGAIAFRPWLLGTGLFLAGLLAPHPAHSTATPTRANGLRADIPAPTAGAVHGGPWPGSPSRPRSVLELERALFEATNRRRASAAIHLEPLEPNPGLRDIAAMQSARLRDEGFFSHRDPDGMSARDRIHRSMRTAFGPTAENLVRLTDQPGLAGIIMDAWMNSPGHRKTILNPVYTDLGVGCAEVRRSDADRWVHCAGEFLSLYASLKQPLPDTVKAGDTIDVEIAAEHHWPVPDRLRQTDLGSGAVRSVTALVAHAGVSAGRLLVRGPAGVYRLEVEIPDRAAPGRYIIVPGPYLNVSP